MIICENRYRRECRRRRETCERSGNDEATITVCRRYSWNKEHFAALFIRNDIERQDAGCCGRTSSPVCVTCGIDCPSRRSTNLLSIVRHCLAVYLNVHECLTSRWWFVFKIANTVNVPGGPREACYIFCHDNSTCTRWQR